MVVAPEAARRGRRNGEAWQIGRKRPPRHGEGERGELAHAAISDLEVGYSAAAKAEGLTVLRYGADFDRVAAVTGQRTEWAVPPGSVD